MPQFRTLKELIDLHKEKVTEILKNMDEIIGLTQEDWLKINTKKGNIARGRELRTGLTRLMVEQEGLSRELFEAVSEIKNFSSMKTEQIKLRREVYKGES